MNPKEKLPIVSDNMNSVDYRPQTVNPITENEGTSNITSREAGNEVKRAVESFEQKLAQEGSFK